MSREIGGSVCGLLHELDVRPHRILSFETSQQQLTPSDHDREQIVEVVRDTTGEPSDGFHLACLSELILGHRELVVGAARLLVQTTIFEGHGRLRGERQREGHVFLREPAVSFRPDAQNPSYPLTDLDRDHEHAALAEPTARLTVRRQ